jgi:hypothetical protein
MARAASLPVPSGYSDRSYLQPTTQPSPRTPFPGIDIWDVSVGPQEVLAPLGGWSRSTHVNATAGTTAIADFEVPKTAPADGAPTASRLPRCATPKTIARPRTRSPDPGPAASTRRHRALARALARAGYSELYAPGALSGRSHVPRIGFGAHGRLMKRNELAIVPRRARLAEPCRGTKHELHLHAEFGRATQEFGRGRKKTRSEQ